MRVPPPRRSLASLPPRSAVRFRSSLRPGCPFPCPVSSPAPKWSRSSRSVLSAAAYRSVASVALWLAVRASRFPLALRPTRPPELPRQGQMQVHSQPVRRITPHRCNASGNGERTASDVRRGHCLTGTACAGTCTRTEGLTTFAAFNCSNSRFNSAYAFRTGSNRFSNSC